MGSAVQHRQFSEGVGREIDAALLRSERLAAIEEKLTQILEALPTVADSSDALLGVAEVAEHLGVSARTVERLIAEGELRAVRIRGQRRFARSAVDAFVRLSERSVRGRLGSRAKRDVSP